MFKNILKRIERKKVFNGLEEETKEFAIQFLNKTNEYRLEVNKNYNSDSLNITVFDKKTKTSICLVIFFRHCFDLTNWYQMIRDKSIDLERFINKLRPDFYREIKLSLIDELSEYGVPTIIFEFESDSSKKNTLFVKEILDKLFVNNLIDHKLVEVTEKLNKLAVLKTKLSER